MFPQFQKIFFSKDAAPAKSGCQGQVDDDYSINFLWKSSPLTAALTLFNVAEKIFMEQLPRIIQIIQCSNPQAWYAELLFEEFTVIERCNGNYIVDTWNGYGQLVMEFIKISDTKTVQL